MWKSIKAHIYLLFCRTSTTVMYFLMLAFVMIHFIRNVTAYYGYDVSYMYHPMKLLFLTSDHAGGFYLLQYYPLLVVVPAAFEYFHDASSREIVFLQARTGRATYYISKMCATFSVTFFIYGFPLFMELILNCIAFPGNALGDLSHVSYFDQNYIEGVQRYFLSDLWIANKYLYAFVFLMIFAAASGILACFAQALSMCIPLKTRIFIFIPVYVCLFLVNWIGGRLELKYSTSYFDYFDMLSLTSKSESAFFIFFLVLLLINVVIMLVKIRKDEVL